MKAILLNVFFLLLTSCLFAQKDTVHLKKTATENKTIVTDRPPQAVYFQFGGSGPLLSVNYDRRFGKRVNGAGITGGLGFYGGSGGAIISVPVSLNYLIGRKSDFIELAGGATYANASFSFFDSDSNKSLVFYHLNAGYRHQSVLGGFFFRGGISPLFFDGGYVTSFYAGVGYNF